MEKQDNPFSSKRTENPLRDPIDIENWYDSLKDHTFPTTFIPITEDHAQAILDFYDDARHHSDKIVNNPDRMKILHDLEDQIQKLIDLSDEHAAFVRLSTRSPKDVALKRKERTKKILDDELHQLDAKSDIQKQIVAIIRCATRSLRFESGKEAVDFLVHSERTFQDLMSRMLSHGNTENWYMNIVVRPWVAIKPELEFRGFVNNGKMTALTQYYKACFVPEIAARKSEIEKQITEFHNSIQDLIPVKSYVADFVIDGDKVWLIELNHFGTTASPGLFSWSIDNKVMHEGPFEFRVLTSLPENAKQQIARPLQELIGWDMSFDIKTASSEEKKKCIIS